jgi:hypothetical protein
MSISAMGRDDHASNLMSIASPLVKRTGQTLFNSRMTSELQKTRCRDFAKAILAKP